MSEGKDLEQQKREAAERAKELAKKRLAEKQQQSAESPKQEQDNGIEESKELAKKKAAEAAKAKAAALMKQKQNEPSSSESSTDSVDEKELAKKKAAAAAKAKAAALAKQKAIAQTDEIPNQKDNQSDDDAKELAKKKAAAAAKAKAAALAKQKAKDSATDSIEQPLDSDKELAKKKAAAAAKAKAAALAKQKAASQTGEETDDEVAKAKAKAAAVAKAKAAAAAKVKAKALADGGDSGDADKEKAKAIAAAKAKAAAAAKAKAGNTKQVSAEPEEEKKPSVNQPYLDKYEKVIKDHLGEEVLEDSYINNLSKDVPTLVAKSDTYFKIAQFLKYNEQLGFDYLSELHGTDFETHMEVYMHLYSYKNKQSVALKVKIDRNEPVIDSVQPLWEGANWPGCEAYDLLGIRFTNHPDLKRILLPEEWVGYPLRKDYEPYDVEV